MSDIGQISDRAERVIAQEVLSELDAEFAELEVEIQRISALPQASAPEKVALLDELRRKWKERLASKSNEDEEAKPKWRQQIDKALEGAIGEILDDQQVDIDGNLSFSLDNDTVQKHAPKVMQALAAGLGQAMMSGGMGLSPSGVEGGEETGAQQLMRQLLAGVGTAFGKALAPVAAGALQPNKPATAETPAGGVQVADGVGEPAPLRPAASSPAASSPAASSPAASSPAAPSRAAPSPADSSPAASSPADSSPADSSPAASSPAASSPAASSPADSSPADSSPDPSAASTSDAGPAGQGRGVEPTQGHSAAVLLRRLELERVEDGLFRGYPIDTGRPRIFGGLVAAQGLLAAARTVDDPDRHAHSLHAYFLRQGEPGRPIDYEVWRVRDGRSFSTRRVEAIQGNTTIFSASVGFHRPEPGMAHQVPMPDTPPPDVFPTHQERLAGYAERAPNNLVFKFLLREEQVVERRAVDPTDLVAPQPRMGLKRFWFKTAGSLPADPVIHRAALTYASDFELLTTCLEVHGVTWLDPRMTTASLDHALWFHRPFRADEWMLYVTESPSADSGRGFNMGRIYRRDGMLIASVAQEALMRITLGRGTTSE